LICACEEWFFRARGGCGQNHGGGGIEELSPVMFADAENIQVHLVRELNLFLWLATC
jgi:hypothetical protein